MNSKKSPLFYLMQMGAKQSFLFFLYYTICFESLTAQTQFPAFSPINPNNSHTHSRYRYQLPSQQINPLQRMRQEQSSRTRRQNQAIIERTQRKNYEQHKQVQAALAEENGKRQHQGLFRKAFGEIIGMVENSTQANFQRAVFLSENAFYQNRYSYNWFQREVERLIQVCRKRADAKGASFDKYKVRLEVLNELFLDSLWVIQDGQKKLLHRPFVYDFDDPFGYEFYPKLFVSKLLQTGKGQCHSMPLLYKILADRMSIEAALAFSPSHSYIEFADAKGRRHNFETTNGHLVSDAWLRASGYIEKAALQSGVYMQGLDREEHLLYVLSDLIMNYVVLFGYDKQARQWIQKGLSYDSQNIHLLVHQSNVLTMDTKAYATQLNHPPESEWGNYPLLKQKLEAMYASYKGLDALGYVEVPKEEYQGWLLEANNEKRQKVQSKKGK